MPTTFDVAGFRFNYRVAAVIVRGDAVLLHAAEGDDFWTLPGGRAELGEASPQTIIRELREELEVDATVERLLWIAELFFPHEGHRYHELSLVFLCGLPADSTPMTSHGPFWGREGHIKLQFQWVPIADLPQRRVYPLFLARGLADLPQVPTHVVDIERAN